MFVFGLFLHPTQRAWRLSGLVLAAAWLLCGCAAVSVSNISPKDYLAERRGDVLTTGRLSTLQLKEQTALESSQTSVAFIMKSSFY